MQTNVLAFDQALLTDPLFTLVDFSASWCGLCKLIQPCLGRLEAEWGSSLQILHVDVDHHFALAHRYQIQSLPTLILFKQGVEVRRFSHFSSREDVIQVCETLMGEPLDCPQPGEPVQS